MRPLKIIEVWWHWNEIPHDATQSSIHFLPHCGLSANIPYAGRTTMANELCHDGEPMGWLGHHVAVFLWSWHRICGSWQVILTVLVEPLTKSLLAAGLAGKSMQERGCRAHREKTWSVTWGSVAMYSLLRRCRNGTFAGYPEYIRMRDGNRWKGLMFVIWNLELWWRRREASVCKIAWGCTMGRPGWSLGWSGEWCRGAPRSLGPVLKDESSGPAADSGGWRGATWFGNIRDLSLSVTFLFDVEVARSNGSGILAQLKPWHENMCRKQGVSRVFQSSFSRAILQAPHPKCSCRPPEPQNAHCQIDLLPRQR